MTFKQLYQTICFLVVLNICACLYPGIEWEDLESDYDHVLNVFGLINLDSLETSYIGLYRTTDLDEISQIFVEVDSFYCDCDNDDCWDCDDLDDGYWVYDSIYEPAALIKDARVQINDDFGNIFDFSFIEYDFFHFDTVMYDTIDTVIVDFLGNITHYDTILTIIIDTTFQYRINYYKDTTGTFNPTPETNYYLSIISPGYDTISGLLTTPALPQIDSIVQRNNIVDTISVYEPFDLYWEPHQNGMGMITGEVLFSDWSIDTSVGDWCGGYFDPFMIDLSDLSSNPYTVITDFCQEELNEKITRDYYLRLTAMDDNYYEYFIIGEVGEYSNALLNYPTTKGRSVGIDGGFGFFGSIASDGFMLKISN